MFCFFQSEGTVVLYAKDDAFNQDILFEDVGIFCTSPVEVVVRESAYSEPNSPQILSAPEDLEIQYNIEDRIDSQEYYDSQNEHSAPYDCGQIDTTHQLQECGNTVASIICEPDNSESTDKFDTAGTSYIITNNCDDNSCFIKTEVDDENGCYMSESVESATVEKTVLDHGLSADDLLILAPEHEVEDEIYVMHSGVEQGSVTIELVHAPDKVSSSLHNKQSG